MSGSGPAYNFDSEYVQDAQNPDPEYGYFHGPVVDPNPGWKPSVWATMSQYERRRQGVKAEMIKADIDAGIGPPNPMLPLSKNCTLVCPVVTGPGYAQCGKIYKEGATLRRHLRLHHSGCFEIPKSSNHSMEEERASRYAILKYVGTGNWRRDKFMDEPGCGPEESDLTRYAIAFENRAQEDPDFASQYGTEFRREFVPARPARP